MNTYQKTAFGAFSRAQPEAKPLQITLVQKKQAIIEFQTELLLMKLDIMLRPGPVLN